MNEEKYYATTRKIHVFEFFDEKFNDILTLFQIFTEMLYTFKFNKKNAR